MTKRNMCYLGCNIVTLLVLLFIMPVSDSSLWADWWTYEQGISGPDYWGRLNPGWSLCTKGHNQSPVDIDPKALLFDPSLMPLNINGDIVAGVLINQGYALTLKLDMASRWSNGIDITGGPLSYTYKVSEVRFHFSHTDTDGSEHTVGGKGFGAEVQIFAYNADLYDNLTVAMTSPRGVACLSVLIKTGNTTHPQFERINKALRETKFKGDNTTISFLNLGRFLPATKHYMTYDGSLTHPGCHETVTWIIFNKPCFISQKQMKGLRGLKRDTMANPVLPMAGNIRPVQDLHRRTIRTNIDVVKQSCSMSRDMHYEVNTNYASRRDP